MSLTQESQKELFAEGYIGADRRPYLRFKVEWNSRVFDGLYWSRSAQGILVPKDVFLDLSKRKLIRGNKDSVSHVTNIILPGTKHCPEEIVEDVPISYGCRAAFGNGFIQRTGCEIQIDLSRGRRDFKLYRLQYANR